MKYIITGNISGDIERSNAFKGCLIGEIDSKKNEFKVMRLTENYLNYFCKNMEQKELFKLRIIGSNWTISNLKSLTPYVTRKLKFKDILRR